MALLPAEQFAPLLILGIYAVHLEIAGVNYNEVNFFGNDFGFHVSVIIHNSRPINDSYTSYKYPHAATCYYPIIRGYIYSCKEPYIQKSFLVIPSCPISCLRLTR